MESSSEQKAPVAVATGPQESWIFGNLPRRIHDRYLRGLFGRVVYFLLMVFGIVGCIGATVYVVGSFWNDVGIDEAIPISFMILAYLALAIGSGWQLFRREPKPDENSSL
jgi:hypothetical protein